MEWLSSNEIGTAKIGHQIAEKLNSGDILLLQGPLGAGKTTLAKTIAASLGITKNVTSPTFTLMNVYEITDEKIKERGIEQLVHIDTYRLEKEQELIDIGAEDYLAAPGTICIIEWPEKIPNILKSYKTILVKLEHIDEHTRKISMED